jgi:hypothetical protein
MATTYTIPNRPVGSDVRNIGDIISDFDAILAALNNFDGGNLTPKSVTGEKLSDSLGQAIGISSLTDIRRAKALAPTGALSGFAPGSTWVTAPAPCKITNLKVPSQGFIRVAARTRVFKAGGTISTALWVGLGLVATGGALTPAYSMLDKPPGVRDTMNVQILGGVVPSANTIAYTDPTSFVGWTQSVISGSGNFVAPGSSFQAGHMGELLIPAPAGNYDVAIIYASAVPGGDYGVSGQELYAKVEA